ncbi:hypothetical protein DL765_000346 [Monosporascus sp. GIB2]|nr:hypothetical protein DL765_000346 [Monosporascus sp. GIB2]
MGRNHGRVKTQDKTGAPGNPAVRGEGVTNDPREPGQPQKTDDSDSNSRSSERQNSPHSPASPKYTDSSALDFISDDMTSWSHADLDRDFVLGCDVQPATGHERSFESSRSPSSGWDSCPVESAPSFTDLDLIDGNALYDSPWSKSMICGNDIAQPHLPHEDSAHFDLSSEKHTDGPQESQGAQLPASPGLAWKSILPTTDVPTSTTSASPGGCTCLQQLTSGLFDLNSWASFKIACSNQNASAKSMEIDILLSTCKDWLRKWDSIQNCPSACFLRRELALLLILSVEQLARLQLDFVASLNNDGGDYEDISFLATRSRFHNQPHPGQHPPPPPPAVDRDGQGSRLTSSASLCLSSNQVISIGKFLVDDMSDRHMIIVQLLRDRMHNLRLFIESLRTKLLQAGSDDCCARLDAILTALARHGLTV